MEDSMKNIRRIITKYYHNLKEIKGISTPFVNLQIKIYFYEF